MAIEFITVRRKDDHSVTAEIARQSLRRWPDWEPVPADHPGAEPAQGAPDDERAGAEPAAEPTRKSRRAAATETKE